MNRRRRLRLALAISIWGACSVGCETLHRLGTRKDSDSQPPPGWGKAPEENASGLPPEAQSQHRATTLRGALSSEGADIEKNLGVH
jgi:hypothetical protein